MRDSGNLGQLCDRRRTGCGDVHRHICRAKAARGCRQRAGRVDHVIDHGRVELRQRRAICGIGRSRRGDRAALRQMRLQAGQCGIARSRQIGGRVRQTDKGRGRIGGQDILRLQHRGCGGDRHRLHTGKAQLRAAARNHRIEIGGRIGDLVNRCRNRRCFGGLDLRHLHRGARARHRDGIGIGQIAGRTLAEDGRGAVGHTEHHRMGQVRQLRQRIGVGGVGRAGRGDRAGHIVQHGVRSAQNGRGGIADRSDRQRTRSGSAIQRGRIGNIGSIVRSDRLAAKVR